MRPAHLSDRAEIETFLRGRIQKTWCIRLGLVIAIQICHC